MLFQSKYFVDYKEVEVYGGDGGDGCMSFMKIPRVEFAGPDGGDGGNGGHVIFIGNTVSILNLAYRIFSLFDI